MIELFDYTNQDIIRNSQQLTDYDEIMEVLRARHSFVQGFPIAGAEIVAGTMMVLDGQEHLARRRLLGSLMSDEAIAGNRQNFLFPVIEQTLEQVAADHRDTDGVVRADLVLLAQRFVHRIAARLAGIDDLEDADRADEFIRLIRAIAAGIGADWSLSDPAGDAAEGLKALTAYRDHFFEPSRTRRMKLIDAGEDVPDDLITRMYSKWEDGWDAELPLRESAVLMVGATQTTSASVVLFILRMHDWLEQHPGHAGRVLGEPGFLQRAVFESLRRTVASPARIRRAVDDVELSTGRTIEAGERVGLLFLEANQDPSRFGNNADGFDPDRTITEGSSWGLAFGGGTHACLGRPMITGNPKLETEGTVTTIVRRLYQAGIELDGVPQRDPDTHYPIFTEVPVRLEKL